MTDTSQGGAASGAAQQAQGKAQEVAGHAQQAAQQAAGEARGRARQLVDERSTELGQRLGQQASDLRAVAEQLRGQDKEQPAKVAEQAAQRIERAGSYLSESHGERILADVEDLARRQPWAVALGGLALGFAASRFLKASSERRYQSSGGRAQIGRRIEPDGQPPYSSDAGYVEAPADGSPAGLSGQPIAPGASPAEAS